MKSRLMALVLFFLLLTFGCQNPRVQLLARANPKVQAFISQHPDAILTVTHYNRSYVEQNIGRIRSECGPLMEAVPYYHAALVSGSEAIEVYSDEQAYEILCVVPPALVPIPSPAPLNGSGPSENQSGCPDGYFTDNDGNCRLSNATYAPNESAPNFSIVVPQNNSSSGNASVPVYHPPNDTAYWNQNIGMGTRAEWAEAIAQDDFSNAVCNDMPVHAMRIVQFPSPAVLIPARLSLDLAALNDSFAFVNPEAFVGSPRDPSMSVFIRPNASADDATKDRYYWHCWAQEGDTHLCIIPIVATISAANGVQTKTGAIKLAFGGPLAPFTSACNWTPPAPFTGKMYPYTLPTNCGNRCPGAPSPPPTPEYQAWLDSNIPPNTSECTNPPAPSSGGEGGPHDVVSLPRLSSPQDSQAVNDNKPGPRVNTPTFNRTGCEVDFDPVCPPPDPGYQLCGLCSWGQTMSVLTIDQWHSDPNGHALKLGRGCTYCPSADRCSTAGAYGSCDQFVCLKPPEPQSRPPYYTNCGQCGSGYVDNWQGWGSEVCLNHYYACLAYGCQRILWKCS